jgi:hypothetical protein
MYWVRGPLHAFSVEEMVSMPDFVSTMQLYMASFALHHGLYAACEHIALEIRHTHTLQMFQDNKFTAALETALSALQYTVEMMTSLTSEELWYTLGHLSMIPVPDNLECLKIVQACFAAQLLWLSVSDQRLREFIADSVMYGRLASRIGDTALSLSIGRIVADLRACPQYHFNGQQGFQEMLHQVHVCMPELYARWKVDGGQLAFPQSTYTTVLRVTN